MKKVCGKCKIEKEDLFFSKDKNTKDKLCSMCKNCKSVTMKDLFKKSKDFRDKTAKRTEVSRLQINQIVFEYLLEHPCVDCGIKDPRCLEFDHVKGEKENEISFLKKLGNKNKMLIEMEKCEVRCGNCHKIKTIKDFPCYKSKNENL